VGQVDGVHPAEQTGPAEHVGLTRRQMRGASG
jgi:hypothetical protein